MANKKINKQGPSSKKKLLNKRPNGKVIQKPRDYYRFFIPFIIVITAIIFANTLANDFIDNWDDNINVTNNEIIKHLNWSSLKEIFLDFRGTDYYRPLSVLTYAIEYKFFGLNPSAYHFTNYIIHILNAILVYIFLKRFTAKPLVAAITSLFFAIHPMHVESVAWISERKDVLYALGDFY